MDSIAQDIYYIKQPQSYSIFTATLLWNNTRHLLHKTNPDISYFKLSYVFWEHNDSVGRGTTVHIFLMEDQWCNLWITSSVGFVVIFLQTTSISLKLYNTGQDRYVNDYRTCTSNHLGFEKFANAIWFWLIQYNFVSFIIVHSICKGTLM